MTLTKFMARSTWVAHAFEWEKLLKCHLKGKASKKLANGQNMDYSEKRKRPKGLNSSAPALGLNTIIFKRLLVYAADSGERLQDHWSSGIFLYCSTVKGINVRMNSLLKRSFAGNSARFSFLSVSLYGTQEKTKNKKKKNIGVCQGAIFLQFLLMVQ